MKKVILATIVTLASTTAFADNHPNTGCGLGSMILGKQDSTLKQVVASILNGSYGNQTFGITTGTLGCAKPASFAVNEKANKFIADNMDQLAVDIAKGNGESIDTLASLLEVKDVVSFKTELQSSFDEIYSETTDVKTGHIVNSIVKTAG